jgi:hypothetical protein
MTTKTPSRVAELRTALQTKADEIQNLSAAWKDETGKGHFVISTEQKSAYDRVVNEAQEIRDLLSTEEKAAGIFAYLNESPSTPVSGTDATAAHRFAGQVKSLGQAWLASDAYQEMKAAQFRRLGEGFTLEQSLLTLPSMPREAKDVYSAMGGNVDSGHRPGAVPGLDRAAAAPGPGP